LVAARRSERSEIRYREKITRKIVNLRDVKNYHTSPRIASRKQIWVRFTFSVRKFCRDKNYVPLYSCPLLNFTTRFRLNRTIYEFVLRHYGSIQVRRWVMCTLKIKIVCTGEHVGSQQIYTIIAIFVQLDSIG